MPVCLPLRPVAQVLHVSFPFDCKPVEVCACCVPNACASGEGARHREAAVEQPGAATWPRHANAAQRHIQHTSAAVAAHHPHHRQQISILAAAIALATPAEDW